MEECVLTKDRSESLAVMGPEWFISGLFMVYLLLA
jgi:hypothetical protein